jgi:hypothetical protein
MANKHLFANNATTTVASLSGTTGTTLAVTSSAGFPAPGASQDFLCTLQRQSDNAIEVVAVTAVAGTNWTVQRAQEGTVGLVFVVGDRVELRVTAGGLGDMVQVAGGTMTGPLGLPGNAVNPLEAVPKQQLDSALTIYRRFGSSGVKTPTTATDLVTGIPTWAKRVTVVLNGMSTNGSSGFALTLGTSSGLETTGYTAMSTSVSGGGAVTPTSSTSAFVSDNGSAAGTSFGKVEFFLNSANAWVCSGHLHRITTSSFSLLGGSKTLAGALDRIQFSAVNGTDVFDAGSYEVIWEG